MNFKELKERTHHFLLEIVQAYRKKSPFFDFYHQLHSTHANYFKQLKNKDLDSGKFQNVRTNFVDGVNDIVQKTDLGNVFVSLHQYAELLRQTASQAPLVKAGAADLLKELEELWGRLTELMRNPKHFPLILEILDRFESIEQRFIYFENCERFLHDAGALLNEDEDPPENFGVMDLGFTIKIQTLAKLNSRLNSLQEIYTEACLIFDVKDAEFPLIISKIESGSLWSRVFGESKVIEFIIWFLKGSIGYLHRKFTLEGKLARIPGDLDKLDKQLNLYQKLEKVLPEERYQALIEEHASILAKSCVLMAKHTQNLLECETKLRIDSEILELEPQSQNKYIEAAAKQLTEHTTSRLLETGSSEAIERPKT